VIKHLGTWAIKWLFADPNRDELDPALFLWKMHQRVDHRELPRRRTVVRFDLTGRRGRKVWLVLAPQTRILAAAAPSASQSNKQDKNGRPQPVRDGDVVFRQNCSRCHNAPDAFPPRITTAVVRHMRVRATITDEDMRLVLFYMSQ